jgi:hypothetical protein
MVMIDAKNALCHDFIIKAPKLVLLIRHEIFSQDPSVALCLYRQVPHVNSLQSLLEPSRIQPGKIFSASANSSGLRALQLIMLPSLSTFRHTTSMPRWEQPKGSFGKQLRVGN